MADISYMDDLRENVYGALAADIAENVDHGTMAAVRAGCTCAKCLERKKRARKRGWRL